MNEPEVVDKVELRTPLESMESKIKYLLETVDILRGSVAILKRKVEILRRNQESED